MKISNNLYTLLVYSFISFFIWYPLINGRIPVIIIGFVFFFSMFAVLSDEKFYIRKDYVRLYGLLFIVSLLSFSTFILHVILDLNINISSELYIYIVNFIVAPMLFFVSSKDSRLNPLLVLRIISISTIILIFISIYNQVGLSFNDFNRNSRLQFPFLVNTLAATTVAIITSVLFAVNCMLYKNNKDKFTLLLIIILLFILYILATRFSFLIVFIILLYYTFTSDMVKKIKSIAITILLFVGFVLLDSYYELRINENFLEKVGTIEKINDPLDDLSFAIRYQNWIDSTIDIVYHPLGYGYLTYVYNNQFTDAFLGTRGFNTHNEILLQFLGIGWIPTTLLIFFFVTYFLKLHTQIRFKYYFPFLISVIISMFFDTFTNNPNSINIMPLTFFVMGILLNNNSTNYFNPSISENELQETKAAH